MAPEVVDYLPTRVGGGNLRAMVAPDIGGEMLVPNGSVGLVKSTGNLSMNWVTDRAIGGDYQMFDVTGAIRGGYYYANRGIGVVRAGSVDLRPLSLTRSFFAANYDNVGQDGIIDLFDVSGDFLGPAITTGFGGNVRYIRVGGLITPQPAGFSPSGTGPRRRPASHPRPDGPLRPPAAPWNRPWADGDAPTPQRPAGNHSPRIVSAVARHPSTSSCSVTITLPLGDER